MSKGLSLAIFVSGVIIAVAGLLFHYMLTSLEIFPHFSVVVGVVGALIAAFGAWGMWSARQSA